MLDKKGQIGEGLTWIVATVIIVVILLISVSIVGGSDLILNLDKEVKSSWVPDRVAEKSFISYLGNNNSGSFIYEELREEEDFNGVNGPLAKEVLNLYSGYYSLDPWLGVVDVNKEGLSDNNYFGKIPTYFSGSAKSYSYIIKFDEEKGVRIILTDNR